MASGRDANPEVAASLDAARATLGIPSFASRDEARRAYRALARAFHPDKGGDVNRFREVRKAHERLEAAWDASLARHPRDGSTADPVASPETKRDDGRRRNAPAPSTTEPNPVAPTRDLEALAAEAFDSGDYARARDILDAVIARALADERDGRDSPSSPGESEKEKKTGGLAEAFLSRARACAALGDWPSALVDADDALAHRGLWLEPHVVRAQALERLGRHREAEESYAKVEHLSEGDSEDGSSFSSFDDDDDDDDDDARSTSASSDASIDFDDDDFAPSATESSSVSLSTVETPPKKAEKEKGSVSLRSSTVAAEGGRRCRDANAARARVFETRDSGAGVVAVAFAPRLDVVCDASLKKSSSVFLATADDAGVVSIWSVPSGRRAFRLDATCRVGSGATSEARKESRDERKKGDGKKTTALSTATATANANATKTRRTTETASDASSVASLVWGPVSGDGELRLVATTERGDATLWRFASNVSSEDEREDEHTSESVLRLKATHGLVVDDDKSPSFIESRPAVAVFARTAALVGVGDGSGRLRVFDATDGTLRRVSRRAHAGAVTCLAFHPQKSWQVTTGGADGDGRAWDLEGVVVKVPGKCQHTFRWRGADGVGSQTSVTDAQYTPCGRLIVLVTAEHLGNSGKGSYRLLVWSAVTGRLCTWHDAHAAPITSLAWERTEGETDEPEQEPSADATKRIRRRRKELEENVVVTSCEDGALRLWALRGAPQGAGKPLHECWAYAAGNAKTYAKTSLSAKKRAWRRGGLGGPPVARGAASCAARSPGGGGLLATAHVDGTVRVLEASSFRTVEAWSLGAAQRACAWASTNFDTKKTTRRHLLASGGADGFVRVWRVETEASLDAVAWRDPEDGVVPAVGPGELGSRRALPASTLLGVSSERVSLALEAFGGENSTKRKGGKNENAPFSMFDHATTTKTRADARALPAADRLDGPLAVSLADDVEEKKREGAFLLTPEDTRGLPVEALAFAFGDAAAAAAETREKAWREKLAESEAATRALSAERRAYVRDAFPRMTPSQRRAYNTAYAEKMAPLRATRARFWNLVRSHGYGEARGEDPAERERDERAT